MDYSNLKPKHERTLIVMVGAPGSGKSTIAESLKEAIGGCEIVSRDAIRFSLLVDGDDYFAHEKEVERRYYAAISNSLADNPVTIADATHIDEYSRAKLFRRIEVPEGTYKIAVYMKTGTEDCLKFNAMREDIARVPDEVVEGMMDKMTFPHAKEGFDFVIGMYPKDAE